MLPKWGGGILEVGIRDMRLPIGALLTMQNSFELIIWLVSSKGSSEVLWAAAFGWRVVASRWSSLIVGERFRVDRSMAVAGARGSTV